MQSLKEFSHAVLVLMTEVQVQPTFLRFPIRQLHLLSTMVLRLHERPPMTDTALSHRHICDDDLPRTRITRIIHIGHIIASMRNLRTHFNTGNLLLRHLQPFRNLRLIERTYGSEERGSNRAALKRSCGYGGSESTVLAALASIDTTPRSG